MALEEPDHEQLIVLLLEPASPRLPLSLSLLKTIRIAHCQVRVSFCVASGFEHRHHRSRRHEALLAMENRKCSVSDNTLYQCICADSLP